jgi:hypothetical protein
MKLWHFVNSLLGIAMLAGAITLIPHHVGPVSAYPDPSLTPGVVATTDIHELTNYTASCGTYSECHRNTSQALKGKVLADYPDCAKSHEIDHIVPLALGGADSQGNLWCQNGEGKWNYHDKDRLEALLVIKVKSGTMTPTDAQQEILKDWIAAYIKYFGSKPSYGNVDSLLSDTDDFQEGTSSI